MSTAIEALIREIVPLLRGIVREELAALTPDEWIPHTKWPVQSARVACQLARSGQIQAHPHGKLWLARRSEIDRWVQSSAPSIPPARTKPSNDYDASATMDALARRRRKSA